MSTRSGPVDWTRLSRQADLTEGDIADIVKRLDRMDARSACAPWTRKTLRMIERSPGIVSTELALEVGMERFDFKANVRKLKRLGLTHSLEVGYRLSPRGQAFLKRSG